MPSSGKSHKTFECNGLSWAKTVQHSEPLLFHDHQGTSLSTSQETLGTLLHHRARRERAQDSCYTINHSTCILRKEDPWCAMKCQRPPRCNISPSLCKRDAFKQRQYSKQIKWNWGYESQRISRFIHMCSQITSFPILYVFLFLSFSSLSFPERKRGPFPLPLHRHDREHAPSPHQEQHGDVTVL